MLRSVPAKYKSRWRDHLNKVVHAYNYTKHDVTGYSPFLLLFGRPPQLAIDLMFGLKPPPGYSMYPEFVKKWRDAMSEAYQLTLKQQQKRLQAEKYSTTRKPKVQPFNPVIACLYEEVHKRKTF